MKITFSNLGAIKKATLDLRPLTVIIGPNNSNKTYIAYSIYGLWNSLNDIYIPLHYETIFNYEYEDTMSLKIDKIFLDYLLNSSVDAVNYSKTLLETFFQDSSKKIFSETKFEITFSNSEIKEKIKKAFNQNKIFIKEEMDIFLEQSPLRIMFNIERFWKNASAVHERSDVQLIALEYIISMVFPKPFLLPAERNAFIITYKMLANRRYKFLRDMQRERTGGRRVNSRQIELLKEQGDIRYPQPIEDFLDLLTDVELQKNTIEDSKKSLKFHELASTIEETIQGNNKTNFKRTKLGGKEIKINVKKGLDIDLYNASSSIKQLAPLLLYLRYRAKENDLLIIDEPEMNLHPESQAKFLEVLGMLVNAGVNVLLTTHSPYFMSHLNNLIAGDMTNEETREKQAKSLYLGDARAFLKPEDVSAYEMRQNKKGEQMLHDLHDKDYGIRWDTLSDVSADIQQKFFEIYENGKETSNGKEK